MNSNYTADKIAIAVAAAFDRQLLELIENHFGQLNIISQGSFAETARLLSSQDLISQLDPIAWDSVDY
jgi:hypothetical protein